MNPIYKFEMQTIFGSVTTENIVYPLYKDDLAKDYEIEQGEKFYRAKLSGKLKFVGPDYDIINNARFESQFKLSISISLDGGHTWVSYWQGQFYKTDGKVDADNKVFEVTPTPVDDYTAVLSGMEKEFNLIDLKPEIHAIGITKRPMIQVYVPGASKISCFLSGMAWEQDCDSVTDEGELVNTYNFRRCYSERLVQVSGDIFPDATGVYHGENPLMWTVPYEFTSGNYKFRYRYEYVPDTATVYDFFWEIVRSSDSTILWQYHERSRSPEHSTGSFVLARYDGSVTGDAQVFISNTNVYSRYLLDSEKFGTLDSQPLPVNDMVADNRNYRRVLGYEFPDAITFSSVIQSNPTSWGIKKPGEYYVQPYYPGVDFFPVCRSEWGDLSIWFAFEPFDALFENRGYKNYVLRDANPISSVISVLLGKIAPGITHEATSEYSQFLYGNTPVKSDKWHLYLTAKSNILAGLYTQPAQKAPITLKTITDMLRNCFAAYWYIDDGKFKIEHIAWFKNGGTYTGIPEISHNLTLEYVSRNKKKWAFGTSQYDFEKPTMPERYQFGWMDDVTEFFDGRPVEIISRFVQLGNIEEINISNFTSDVDYMLLNPSGCSEDGFALLAAVDDTEFDQMNYTLNDNILTTDALQIINGNIVITFNSSPDPEYKYRLAYYQGDILMRRTQWFAASGSRTESVPARAESVAFEFTRDDGEDVIFDDYATWDGSIKGIIRRLPILKIADNRLSQNGYVAFEKLIPQYLTYDMPSYLANIGENALTVYGILRNKKQTVRFPVVNDPIPNQLIKTNLGDGQIEKISINLSSRIANATLVFDTYNSDE